MLKPVTFVIMLSFFLLAVGQEANAQGTIQLGIVNMGIAIDNSKDGKAANKKVQKKYDELSGKLKTKQDALQKKLDDLDAVAPSLSEADLTKRRQELTAELEAFQRDMEAADQEMEAMAKTNYTPLYEKAQKLVGELAQEKGIVSVIENSTEERAYIYAAANVQMVDMTADLTALMDKKK
ncbi:MAG: OmpH family outer membrane protein [Deltaproteobacteria bacterium]|jgi:Skp family chaperone for outer membrane proteins|nr:OmpH family outer membrane protein [Deltaproteobacteria bacterium]